MYGFINGISDNDDITYCPRCGDETATYHADGTVTCGNCGFHFGVVECEDDEENCSLQKKIGEAGKDGNGMCMGFSRSEIDDEPCEICKKCKLYTGNDEDERWR